MAIIGTVAYCLFVAAAPAHAEGPLYWHEPAPMADFDATFYPNGVSCPDESLCVAVGLYGNYATTNTPTLARSWKFENAGIQHNLGDVDCPTRTLCVATAATDTEGGVMISRDPQGGGRAWAFTKLSDRREMQDVSCPSESFCAAVDRDGYVHTSTNPTGAADAWTRTPVGRELNGIDCPTADLCVAVNVRKEVITSTNPRGGAAAWKTVALPNPSVSCGRFGSCGGALWEVACPRTGLCVTADSIGNVLWSTDPTGDASAWSSARLDRPDPTPDENFGGPQGPNAVACASTSLCAAVGRTLFAHVSANPTGGAAAWGYEEVGDETRLDHVACPSERLCVGITGARFSAATTERPPSLSPVRLRSQLVPRSTAARTLARRKRYRLPFETEERGYLAINWTARPRGASVPVRIASGGYRFDSPGNAAVAIRLTRRGSALLRRSKRVRVTATATFDPARGETLTAARSFTLRR